MENQKLSNLINLTNILGLAVIIALSVVIKILLTQKVTTERRNKHLEEKMTQQDVLVKETIAKQDSLQLVLADIQSKQGCESYIKELQKVKGELTIAKNENYKILRSFQSQANDLKSISEKAKVLESFMRSTPDFPN